MASEREPSKARSAKKLRGEEGALAKIAAMSEAYREAGERLHALIMGAAPSLQPDVWYGMPAYRKDGKVICYFRADTLMTFGLTEDAHLEPEAGAGHQLVAAAWYFGGVDTATEEALTAIVRRAAG